MSIHLNIFRQFVGVNTIATFGGIMVSQIDATLGIYAGLILNAVQGFFTVLSTFWFINLFGKKPLYLISALLIGLCCFLVMAGYLANVNLLKIVPMVIYMVLFGLLFGPISWSYPSEIIPATKNTIATSITWVALSLTTLIPPIVIKAMDGNAYPLFLFFGVYCALSFPYMYAGMVETKGLKYQNFIGKF